MHQQLYVIDQFNDEGRNAVSVVEGCFLIAHVVVGVEVMRCVEYDGEENEVVEEEEGFLELENAKKKDGYFGVAGV